jgi:hypothetical protein
VFVQQNILELQVSMYAGLLMNVRDGAHQLRERFLDFLGGQRTMVEEIVVELVACGISAVILHH